MSSEKLSTNINELKVKDRTTSRKGKQESGLIALFLDPECCKDTLIMFFAWIATNLGNLFITPFVEIFMTPIFLNHIQNCNFLVLFIHAISIFLAYFGLSLSATSLSDNIYLSFILSGLVELPSLVAIWPMDHWGRKPTLVVSFLLCGICCIVAGYSDGTLKLILALVGNISLIYK